MGLGKDHTAVLTKPGQRLRIRLPQVQPAAAQEGLIPLQKLEFIVEEGIVGRIIDHPSQGDVVVHGHKRLPVGPPVLGKAKDMVIQIPHPIAQRAPDHVTQQQRPVLPRLLVNGPNILIHAPQAGAFQPAAKNGQLGSEPHKATLLLRTGCPGNMLLLLYHVGQEARSDRAEIAPASQSSPSGAEACPLRDPLAPKIQLSSDPASRRTPLPLAYSFHYRVDSDLSPHRLCAHRGTHP